MNLFKINYRKLAALVLPTFFRKKVILSLLLVVAKELDKPKRVYTRFNENREENLSHLKYNSQVCYLRGALNDHFKAIRGSEEFRIEECHRWGNWSYAVRKDSNEQLILERESAFKSSTDPFSLYDMTCRFVVHYPSTIDNSPDLILQMRELVERHRLVGYQPLYKYTGEPQKKCWLSACDPENCKYLRLLDPQKDRFVKPRDPSCVYWSFLDDPEKDGFSRPHDPSCVYHDPEDDGIPSPDRLPCLHPDSPDKQPKECSSGDCDPSTCLYLTNNYHLLRDHLSLKINQ